MILEVSVLSLGLSIFALYSLYRNNKVEEQQYHELLEYIKKLSNKNSFFEKEVKRISVIDSKLSNYQLSNSSEIDNILKKTKNLFKRWDIIADDRITSIPNGHEEWWNAKEIHEQVITRTWKTKSLSQTKSSLINGANLYSENEEEINQDFSQLNDDSLDDILEEEDTESSSGSASTQSQKPKPKKKPNLLRK